MVRQASKPWPSKTLETLVEIVTGQVNPLEDPLRIFQYVAMDNIEAGTGRIVNFEKTAGRDIASTKTAFKKGDLLYGRLRPYQQKVAVAPFDGICATDIIPLRVGSSMSAAYLREFLLSPIHLEYVAGLMAGARMPRLRTSDLLAAPIPTPPTEVQGEIVNALITIRYRIHEAQSHLADALALSGTLRQRFISDGHAGKLTAQHRKQSRGETGAQVRDALMASRRADWEHAEFTRMAEGNGRTDLNWRDRYPQPPPHDSQGTFDLPSEWCWASLSELTSASQPICYGVVQPGEDVQQGVPLVRVQDLQDGQVQHQTLRRIDLSVDDEFSRSRLRGGEVLISVVGSIGRVAIVPDNLSGANIARALARITPLSQVDSRWIANAFVTTHLQEWMSSGAREVARKTLNISTLERAAVPLASADEMQEVVRLEGIGSERLGRLDGFVHHMQVGLKELLADLQARTFRGHNALRVPSQEAVAQATTSLWAGMDGEGQQRRPGRRKVSSRTKISVVSLPEGHRDLSATLEEHPGGLDPLELLEAAGYSLAEVEAFYKQLSIDVANERVSVRRPDSSTSRIVRV